MWLLPPVYWLTLWWVLFLGCPSKSSIGDERHSKNSRSEQERSFSTDLSTLCDCIKHVAHVHGFKTEYDGAATSWDGAAFGDQAKERFVVVADKQKLPLPGNEIMPLGVLGRRSDRRNLAELRRIIVDLDTGKLSGPNGVDLQGLRLLEVTVHLCITNNTSHERYIIDIRRNYENKQLDVVVLNKREDRIAFSREFLKSLESRVKLASKLRDIRRLRGGDQKGQEPSRAGKDQRGQGSKGSERSKGSETDSHDSERNR